MTKRKIWLIWELALVVVALVVVVVGSFCTWDLAIEQGTARYRGRAVFESDAEYGKFKRAIVDNNADIREMNILSSTPPIIADFDVFVDAEHDFGYGEREAIPAIWFVVPLVFLLMGFAISVIFIGS